MFSVCLRAACTEATTPHPPQRGGPRGTVCRFHRYSFFVCASLWRDDIEPERERVEHANELGERLALAGELQVARATACSGFISPSWMRSSVPFDSVRLASAFATCRRAWFSTPFSTTSE